MFCGVPPSDLSRNMDIAHRGVLMNLRCKAVFTAEIGQYSGIELLSRRSQIMRLCYLTPFLFKYLHKTPYYREIFDRTDQKCADSSTYWQFFHYRPPGVLRYSAGPIAKILCKNSIYIYIERESEREREERDKRERESLTLSIFEGNTENHVAYINLSWVTYCENMLTFPL